MFCICQIVKVILLYTRSWSWWLRVCVTLMYISKYVRSCTLPESIFQAAKDHIALLDIGLFPTVLQFWVFCSFFYLVVYNHITTTNLGGLPANCTFLNCYNAITGASVTHLALSAPSVLIQYSTLCTNELTDTNDRVFSQSVQAELNLLISCLWQNRFKLLISRWLGDHLSVVPLRGALFFTLFTCLCVYCTHFGTLPVLYRFSFKVYIKSNLVLGCITLVCFTLSGSYTFYKLIVCIIVRVDKVNVSWTCSSHYIVTELHNTTLILQPNASQRQTERASLLMPYLMLSGNCTQIKCCMKESFFSRAVHLHCTPKVLLVLVYFLQSA